MPVFKGRMEARRKRVEELPGDGTRTAAVFLRSKLDRSSCELGCGDKILGSSRESARRRVIASKSGGGC